MTVEIDARGLACPGPVLETKKAVDNQGADSVRVLVDNDAARENVSRFLESQGFAPAVEEAPGGFAVRAQRQGAPPSGEEPAASKKLPAGGDHGKQLVFVTSECMGLGDDELGLKLMISFCATVQEMGPELWRMIFVNGGVKLCVQGSPVLDSLKELEKNGVSILVCGTCLTFFDLLDAKEVGETTNMLDVVTSLQLADKVIRV